MRISIGRWAAVVALGLALGIGATVAPTDTLAGPTPAAGGLQVSRTATWNDMLAAEAAAGQSATSAPVTLVRPAAPAPIALPVAGPAPLAQAFGAPAAAAAPLAPPSPGGANGPALLNNFAALGDNNASIPPDTHGAVGPNHLMVMLNTEVRIQDKTGANLSTVSLDFFWGGAGHYDPKVVYDALSGRWFATCDRNGGNPLSSIAVAVSTTNDPTGAWTFYTYLTDALGLYWADFPGIGISTDKVVITNNLYDMAALPNYLGCWMIVIRKADLLAAAVAPAFDNFAPQLTPALPTWDNVGAGSGFTLKPSMNHDAVAPIYMADGGWTTGGVPGFRLSTLTGTVPGTVWAVLPKLAASSGVFAVPTAFDYGQIDASQLGIAQRIDTNDPRIRHEPQFRNGALWLSVSGGLPVGAVDRTAAFWYQLDPVTAGPSVLQSGVVQGAADTHFFFPSITANANDDAVMGFSYSDATVYASAGYTGRFAGDAAGTMDAPTIYKAGLGPYWKQFTGPRNRWGDYSATVIDPVDDLTFWTIQEYAEDNGGLTTFNSGLWGTWWATLAPPPPVTLTCPGDLTFECNASGGWQGTISGFSSAGDPAGYPITVRIGLNGAPLVAFGTVASPGAFSVGFPPGVPNPIPCGDNVLEVEIEAQGGATDGCTFNVAVNDTAPPVVTCTVTRRILFPARGGLLNVGADGTVTDLCDASPLTYLGIWSNEANGPPPFTPDVLFVGITVLLRADRDIQGTGRVYLLRIRADDQCSTAVNDDGYGCCTVVVPKVPTAASIMAVMADAAAAEAVCDGTALGSSPGDIPAGYQVLLPEFLVP